MIGTIGTRVYLYGERGIDVVLPHYYEENGQSQMTHGL